MVRNPETLPEVTEKIIEDKVVDPLIKKAERTARIIRFIAGLPPALLVILFFAYAYLKR